LIRNLYIMLYPPIFIGVIQVEGQSNFSVANTSIRRMADFCRSFGCTFSHSLSFLSYPRLLKSSRVSSIADANCDLALKSGDLGTRRGGNKECNDFGGRLKGLKEKLGHAWTWALMTGEITFCGPHFDGPWRQLPR
jgi:hypothetical protein